MTGEHATVYAMLEELEKLPERAYCMLGRRVMIGFDHERFHTLVLKIRANLPEDMKVARGVVRERGRIVGSARQTAEELVAQARRNAENEIQAARTEAERILQSATNQAEDIVRAAQEEAERMVSESQVMEVARTQARETLQRAEAEAGEIRRGANAYARDVLANLEHILSQSLQTIQRGQQRLAEEEQQ